MISFCRWFKLLSSRDRIKIFFLISLFVHIMINNNDILNISIPHIRKIWKFKCNYLKDICTCLLLFFFSPFIFAYFLWKHDRFTNWMSVTLWLSAIIGLRLSDFLKILFFSSLRNAKCITKKAPAGIRELADGLIHRMRINFGEASRASEVERCGRKEDRKVAFWRIDFSRRRRPTSIHRDDSCRAHWTQTRPSA